MQKLNTSRRVVPSNALCTHKLHKKKQRSVDKNNPMYGKHHTETARKAMSLAKQKMVAEGGETRRQIMIKANPRSRPVKTPDGTFLSLSAARRYYGLVSKYSATTRVRRGEWKYV